MKSLLLVVLTACGAGSTYRTTRLAPAGHTEWLFGAQVSGAGTVGVDEGGGKGGAAPLPELAVAARRGLDERFEAQVNATLLPTAVAQTGSLELAGKARLAESGRYSFAVGAGAGYRITQVGGAIIEDVYVSAPLIAGIRSTSLTSVKRSAFAGRSPSAGHSCPSSAAPGRRRRTS